MFLFKWGWDVIDFQNQYFGVVAWLLAGAGAGFWISNGLRYVTVGKRRFDLNRWLATIGGATLCALGAFVLIGLDTEKPTVASPTPAPAIQSATPITTPTTPTPTPTAIEPQVHVDWISESGDTAVAHYSAVSGYYDVYKVWFEMQTPIRHAEPFGCVLEGDDNFRRTVRKPRSPSPTPTMTSPNSWEQVFTLPNLSPQDPNILCIRVTTDDPIRLTGQGVTRMAIE